MGTAKRARQKANRAAKLEAVQKIEKRDQRRQYVIIVAVVAVGLAAGLYLLSLGGNGSSTAASTTTTAASAATSSTAATPTTADKPSAVSAPAPGATSTGTPTCPKEDGSSQRTTTFGAAPPNCIDAAATYVATVTTSKGVITWEMDASKAPKTVNNFVFLARYHYYDGVPFHRIIPGFVIQGGDANGNPLGTGSPGYSIGEEPPAAGYQVGTVAMAKTQAANSTGSQFFVVTGPQGAQLPPQYSLLGTVTQGMDVVKAIEAIPTNAQDAPTEPITITSVTIAKK